MSDVAIRVENLGKLYHIGGPQTRYKTIRESIQDGFKAPFRRAGRLLSGQAHGAAELERTIWALKDVSFEVKQGEVVGIIGRNGAGKSTLLKILSRITEPTEGEVMLRGRVGSLLEVGTGFHPELTGRENIYLNGAILGMKRVEIDRKFDEIVDFSEIEKFIDTPVKHYSSGMYVRLAFSVAAHLEPEVLLVDEVLAVGDMHFQKKCLGKMGEVAKGGRAVIFVSHNLSAVRSLTRMGVLINDGKIVYFGSTVDVIDKYLKTISMDLSTAGSVSWTKENAPGSNSICVVAVRLTDSTGCVYSAFNSDQEIFLEIHYDVWTTIKNFRFAISIITSDGEVAFRTTDHQVRNEILFPGKYYAKCVFPANLFNHRRYGIEISGGEPRIRNHIPPTLALWFEVLNSGSGAIIPEKNWPGILAPKIQWVNDIIRE